LTPRQKLDRLRGVAGGQRLVGHLQQSCARAELVLVMRAMKSPPGFGQRAEKAVGRLAVTNAITPDRLDTHLARNRRMLSMSILTELDFALGA